MSSNDEDMGLKTVFVDDKPTSRELHKAKLVVLDGEDEGEEFEIDKSQVYVGRNSVNDFVLSDKSISGTHFEIKAEEKGFLLKDLDSTNGVYLEGCRVKEIYLEPHSTFLAGNSKIRFEPVDETVEIPLSEEEHFKGVIGRSVPMREVFATLNKVAPSDLTCLIHGETGTGKERIAQAIHDASRRQDEPYVVLDCSAIPRDLMESHVFGHEKGAFTGAVDQKIGAFEQAGSGTLFLDEIGELDMSLQPKLLRVLENREFKRVGGNETLRADCRIIAATNRDLREMVNEDKFREDLFFRLSVVQISLPPLKDRREDIPLLVEHFIDEASERRPDKPKPRLTADARDMLMSHSWPGNVRQLRNVIMRSASLCEGDTIERADLQLSNRGGSSMDQNVPAEGVRTVTDGDLSHIQVDLTMEFKDAKQKMVEQFEKDYLKRIYENHDHNISQSAKTAGLTRYHLRELLKKHELKED
jgi:transcriptional regulator with GAF, ATPase, and Fis domain